MKIACITATWNRPELLGRMIACFERQTHEDRTLLILDDTGQYGHRKGDRWELISFPKRINKYAHKLNAAAAMLPDNDGGLCVWDDDDVYLPHALAACSAALERGTWAQPRIIYEHREGGLKRMNTAIEGRPAYLYHGTWCYRKQAFDDIGGYQLGPPHFDYKFGQLMAAEYGESVDTACSEYPDPHYIFCRDTEGDGFSWPLGEVGYDRRLGEPIVKVDTLSILWQLDYTQVPVIGEDLTPRPQ